MLVFEERGKPEYREKNLSEKGREPTKLNPHMASTPGFEPGLHWWGASALTTAHAPPLLPNKKREQQCAGIVDLTALEDTIIFF